MLFVCNVLKRVCHTTQRCLLLIILNLFQLRSFLNTGLLLSVKLWQFPTHRRLQLRGTIKDAKSEEHEERAPAIFPPAVLIFGLPTQKIC